MAWQERNVGGPVVSGNKSWYKQYGRNGGIYGSTEMNLFMETVQKRDLQCTGRTQPRSCDGSMISETNWNPTNKDFSLPNSMIIFNALH